MLKFVENLYDKVEEKKLPNKRINSNDFKDLPGDFY